MSISYKIKLQMLGIFICCYVGLSSILAAEFPNPPGLTLTVHNVGQGNCITVCFNENGHEEFMLIDVGSSSYGKELQYHKQEIEELMKRKEPKEQLRPEVDTPNQVYAPSTSMLVTPQKFSAPISPPHSILQKKTLSRIRTLRSENSQLKQSAIKGIRQALGDRDGTKPIKIKTIVITHPDIDHYRWLKDTVKTQHDDVKNIVLAGLPENYNEATRLWLYNMAKAKVRIFFPSHSYEPIKPEDLYDIRNVKMFAEHACSLPDGVIKTDSNHNVPEAFSQAFQFGKDLKVFLLTINPLHFQGKTNIVRLYDSKEDDNKESLVIKLGYKKFSAILTGDATQATINRVFDNYGKSLEFLKTDVLLASHHGSSTHGSNSTAWLAATSPKLILISNGLSYGHPSKEAYDRFHTSSVLKNVTRHDVLVGRTELIGIEEEEEENEGEEKEGGAVHDAILHQTKSGIFATLGSGTLSVKFTDHEMDMKIHKNTENEKHIELNSFDQEPDKDKMVKVDEEEQYIELTDEDNWGKSSSPSLPKKHKADQGNKQNPDDNK